METLTMLLVLISLPFLYMSYVLKTGRIDSDFCCVHQKEYVGSFFLGNRPVLAEGQNCPVSERGKNSYSFSVTCIHDLLGLHRNLKNPPFQKD